MFSAIARVFRTPDLRRKIAFTLGIIAIYRLGAHVPTPFVDFGNDARRPEFGQRGGDLRGRGWLRHGCGSQLEVKATRHGTRAALHSCASDSQGLST